MAKLPSVTEVNAAKGEVLRGYYKQVIGEDAEKGAKEAVLKQEIINQMKADANAANSAKKPDALIGSADLATSTEKAATAAEAKGEWLTAALAWESLAKMLAKGKGQDTALARAAKARINHKNPPAATSTPDDAAAKAKKETEKMEAKAKKDAEALAAKSAKDEEKAKAKALKDEERAAKKIKEDEEALATKTAKEEAAKAKAAEKEEAAKALATEREAKNEAAKAEHEAKVLAAAQEKEAKKAARLAEREAKRAEKGIKPADAPFEHDPRIAHMVGQTIVHTTKTGIRYEVKVEPDGFAYKGTHYNTLSGVGRYCNAGKSTNGFVFFGLTSAPNPALKDEEAIVEGFNSAAEQSDMNGSGDLNVILEMSTPEAHEHLATIGEEIEALEARVKALRLGCRLIEAKKGRPAPTA